MTRASFYPTERLSGARMFIDRRAAGRDLAQALLRHAGTRPVAEVARVLDGTLDVVARKLGVPIQPELGMGAIAEGPAVFLDRRCRRDCVKLGPQLVPVRTSSR